MSAIGKVSFRGESSNFLNKISANPAYSTGSNPTSSNSTISKPIIQDSVQNELKTLKITSYSSSALAVASLITAGIVIRKTLKMKEAKAVANQSFNRLKQEMEDLGKTLGDDLDKKIKEFKSEFGSTIQAIKSDITNKSKWHDGAISGLRNDLNKRIDSIPKNQTVIKDGKIPAFFTKNVNINGKEMRLATVFNEISGENEVKLSKALQKEAATRILGSVERLTDAPEHITVRIPTSEIRPFSSTGGMSIVPKELITNLAGLINTKQKATLLLDTPLYKGNVANNTIYNKFRNVDEEGNFDGTYRYVKKIFNNKGQSKTELMTNLHKIDEMDVPIYTDSEKTLEKVNLYLSDTIQSPLDYNLLEKRLKPEVIEEINRALNLNKEYDSDLIHIKKNPATGLPQAFAKYKTVFYESPKFNLDGRINKGANINIYRDDAISAGETERMVYFSKFFSEHLMDGENSKVPLSADVIIGNDWQTGPISAIMRQLTTARKFYGMDPEKADKLHNIPIITLFHNAGLNGSVWHSQDKLFNIMFGEHASKILENSHMINTRISDKGGLPSNLWNGMMNGESFNPQLMAANYSDHLVPVSEKYGREMAEHSGFGGAGTEIFKIRGRSGEYADMEDLKFIARNNGINQNLIPQEGTMKGITNGCDEMNNLFTAQAARKLESSLGIKVGSFKELKEFNGDVAAWHKHNKSIYLNKVIDDINLARNTGGKDNPMNIELFDKTDLTGVTADTPVFSTAGRIVDQKGLDIFAASIKEFYKNFKGDNYPVFYAQGVGDEMYIKSLLKVKEDIAKTNPEAAKRIVFARLFSEPGRYDGCKLMSDFSVMSSWFEPCGLVHKEIAKYSAAVPVVLKVGGLTDGLKDGTNAIFADFMHKYDNNYDQALAFNAQSFANGMKRAYEWFSDKSSFAKALEASFNANHSWLNPGGAIDKYGQVLVNLKVLKPEIINSSAV